MVWAGAVRSSSSQRRASRNALMKPSRAFVRMARKGRCASLRMISRRRREDETKREIIAHNELRAQNCPADE